jgi:UDP-N-acetylglucosamine---dolichyl-phosphate N-acetylglucosaminyltransferase
MKTGKQTSSRICLIIPAYNEASVIGGVITSLRQTFRSKGYTPYIVVVDDGSKDDTAAQAAAAGAYVIPHILNTGSGGATATGLSYAQQSGYDIAATLDADGQHAPEDVLKGITLMEQGDHDLLIGSRLLNAEGMSWVKQLGNNGLSTITYLLFGIKVTDSQSGLRVFSRKALNELKWKTSGFEFCSEMLWRAKQQKMRIDEYPIRAIYTDYSKAKGQNNWNGFNIVKSLIVRRAVELFDE